MKRAPVLAAVAGVLVALAIVGGFMAIDRTVVHWYMESGQTAPTPGPTRLAGPAFTQRDVVRLVQQYVARVYYEHSPRCEADFRRGNRMWVVTCYLYVAPIDRTAEFAITYLFDDRTGQIVR